LLLIAAACGEGIGSDSLASAFKQGRDGVPARVAERYTINSQTAMSILEITGRIDVKLFSELSTAECGKYGFGTWRPEEIPSLIEGVPREEILVIPEAASFLPVMD